MIETDRPVVISVATLLKAWLIDGGDTVATQFTAPDGRNVAMLVPLQAALALQASLFNLLPQSTSRDFPRR